jgi:hypothetical protein
VASFGGFATGIFRHLTRLRGGLAVSPCRDIAAALGLLGGVLVCASGLLVRLTGPLMCLRGLELRLLGGVDGAGCALGRRVNALVRTPASFSELGCAICGSAPSLPCVCRSRRPHLARSLRVTWTSVHPFSGSRTLDLDKVNARCVNVDADSVQCPLQSPGPLALGEVFTRPPGAVLFADAHWLPGMKLIITVLSHFVPPRLRFGRSTDASC